MRNKVISVLCALFCLACVAQAQSIIWVSSGWNAAEPNDKGFVDLLIEQGYDVTRLDDPENLTQAKIDLMNGADLVVMARQANSGGMASDEAEITGWNSIETPLILQSAWIARSNRWRWLNSVDAPSVGENNMIVIAADDPVYYLLGLAEGDSVDLTTGSFDHVPVSDYGPGTLVGMRDNETYPRNWIVRWQAGDEFYPGSGQVAGGERLYFITGERLDSLTSLGQAMFLNAVYDMSGATFNRAPLVTGDTLKAVWAGSDLPLSAAVVDDGLPAPSTVTFSWSAVGPEGAVVTFTPADAVDTIANFDTAGVYEVTLEANDGDKVTAHNISVTVADPAAKGVVGHWSMDSISISPAALVVDDASDNDGMFVGALDDPLTSTYIEEPNLVIPGWVGAQALDMYSDGWVEVAPGSDPNAFNLRTGVSISAWIKTNGTLEADYPTIIAKGDVAWRISASSAGAPGGIHFNCNGTSGRINSQRKIDDGNWHHVVGVYDAIAERSALYIDGILDTEIEASGLINVNDDPVWIGNNFTQQARMWDGALDDIYVYNYGISEAEVQALAADAPKPTFIDLGEDMEYKRNAEGLTLSAVVADDEMPQAAALTWSVTSKPEGADDPVFTPADSAETVIKFSAQGEYELTLTADDSIFTTSDSIIITVVDPTCQDVIDAGLLLVGDLNQDCYLDINDFAMMAANWLECNDPQNIDCIWAFE